jgi:hypothetical protein
MLEKRHDSGNIDVILVRQDDNGDLVIRVATIEGQTAAEPACRTVETVV